MAKNSSDEYLAQVSNAEVSLGLPKGFIFKLLEIDDDWTFVIKVAFLVESTLLHANIIKLGPEIEKTLDDVGPDKNMELSLRLGIIDDPTKVFVQKVTQLRNKVIHNLKNHSFTFESYLKDTGSRKAFVQAMRPYTVEKVKIEEATVERDIFIKENPKVAILFGLFNLLSLYQLEIEKKKQKYEAETLREALRRRIALAVE